MSLKQRIEADIKTAMLAKDKLSLSALRSIKSMILLAETEKGAEGAITSDKEMQLLTKAAKQRRESADLYQQQQREDLATIELGELEIINRYLPQPLSAEELKGELATIIANVGASGPQDMGKVMGQASKALAGKADGKTIAQVVKQLLTK